jgi:transposase
MTGYEPDPQVISELRRENAELKEIIRRQQRQIERLEKEIERLRREGRRQAAPFSKGPPKADPQRPGRKAGAGYGRRGRRAVPRQVDRTIHVDCPLYCPDCIAEVKLGEPAYQYQIDLPQIVPERKRFIFETGRCVRCGRHIQGRHPEQVSDAVTVGQVHFGPNVLGLTAYLHKVGGLSYGKIARLLSEWMGFEVSRSALCRALQRLARKAQPTYEQLRETIRGSPVVYADETGWKVGGHRAWLWAVTNLRETVYAIESGRGFAQAASILGKDYAGVIGVDGWAPYRRFEQATLQSCLSHLLRRSTEMLTTATAGAVRFPREVNEILHTALALRDRRDAGQITPHGLRVALGRLRARLGRRLRGRFTHPGNRRLARHLLRYEQALFVFLQRDDVEATNWPAEQAIRPAVVNRKTSGGNRTHGGAQAQAVLMSLLRTCHQKGLDHPTVFAGILRASQPTPYQPLLRA